MEVKVAEGICGFDIKYYKNDCMAYNSIGKNNEWEPHIKKFSQHLNKMYNCKNIIDIGANFGYHTLLFSKECSGNVYAFEPQKQNFELLYYNVNHNNIKNVVLYNNACGDVNCDVKMPIFPNNSIINMGDITPNYCNHNFDIVKTVVLDDLKFSTNIDMVKIDVQGWEKKVLLGSLNLLKTHKPILIVEFESFQLSKTNTTCKELYDFIRSCDYYIFYLEYKYPSDHICVHNDKLTEFRTKFKSFIFPHNQNNNINNNLINNVTEKISM